MPLYWIDNPILRHFFVCNTLKFSIFMIIIRFGVGTGRDLSVQKKFWVGRDLSVQKKFWVGRDLSVRICRGVKVIIIYK